MGKKEQKKIVHLGYLQAWFFKWVNVIGNNVTLEVYLTLEYWISG